MADARAAASANAAGLCASKAQACAAKAVSARTRAEEALSALNLNEPSCPTGKKKAISFAEAASVAAEVAEAVAAAATAASNEAEAAAQVAEQAVVAGELVMALEAAKAAASFAANSATASAAAANAAAAAMAAASECESEALKAAAGENVETARGFLLTANSVFASVAAQNIVGKNWPSEIVPMLGYIFNHGVLGGCLAVQGILIVAKNERIMTNCKILFFFVTLLMVFASSLMASRNVEEIFTSFLAMVGFGIVVASFSTAVIFKIVDSIKSLLGY